MSCSEHLFLFCSKHVFLYCSKRVFLSCSKDVLMSCSEHAFLSCSKHIFLSCFKHVLLSSSKHVFLSSSKHVLLSSSKHVFPSCSKHIFQSCSNRVPLSYSKHIPCFFKLSLIQCCFKYVSCLEHWAFIHSSVLLQTCSPNRSQRLIILKPTPTCVYYKASKTILLLIWINAGKLLSIGKLYDANHSHTTWYNVDAVKRYCKNDVDKNKQHKLR